MGVWTLAQFQQDLQKALGNRAMENGWLNRRINAAYEEICGSTEFKNLMTSATFVTVDGTANYDVEADLIGVLAVVDQTNDRKLIRLDFDDYWGRNPDSDAEGDPTHWARDGSCIYLWPTPGTDDDSFRVVYTKRPTHLSSATDVTVIPSTWDMPIYWLSVFNGLMDLAADELDLTRAEQYRRKAFAHIASRRTDRDRDKQSSSRGLQVAHSEEDLIDQEV